MTPVMLGRPPDPSVPIRLRTTRRALERAAAHAGAPLPWPVVADPGPGPAAGPAAVLAGPLAVLAAPAVLVDVDVAVRRGSGDSRLRAWHRWRDGRVAAVATAGGEVELAWFGEDRWQSELARTVDVTVPRRPGPPPDDDLHVPHDTVLATGAALRRGRPDLLAELAARADVPADQLRRLHASTLGRMCAVVSGPGRAGSRRAGWVSWTLHPDGWRALTPYVRRDGDGDVAMVRVHRVPASRLGADVAALVARVRG